MRHACWLSSRLAVFVALLGSSSPALAKRTGMNLACHNCHEGQNPPKLAVALSAMRVEPGQSVTITVTAKHASAKVGGVLVDSEGVGKLELIDPVGTRLFDELGTQGTHAMPHPYQNGQVEFAFRWVAPAMVGTAELDVWSNAGNDNMLPQDDSPAEAKTAVAVGCDAAWYYLDEDKDGSGAEKTRVYSCQPLPNRILQGGDCDDTEPAVHAGSPELCNSRDDNCDGVVDEGFTPMLLVQDLDGDGFGARTGKTMIGCPPQAGYAPTFDDCDDSAATVHPGAAELMNGIDDNCNGQRDEADVTPSAGSGPTPAAPPASQPATAGCALGASSERSPWLGTLLLVGWAAWRRRR